jgi:hypothetical protein
MNRLLTLPLLLAALPLAAPLPAQAADLKQELAKYQEILKSKAEAEEAIPLIDGFNLRFTANRARLDGIRDDLELKQGDPKALEAERKALEKEQDVLADAVYECFVHPKRKEPSQANMSMWKSGAYALGLMGERGAERLWLIFEDKKFKKDIDLLGLVLQQVGATDHWASTEALVDLLDHHEYLYIAKAADALAQFNDAPGSVRHMAVEKMVKLYAQYSEDAESDPQDQEKQEKFRKTSSSLAKALELLTSTQQRTPTDWNTWFNEHKSDKAVWGE